MSDFTELSGEDFEDWLDEHEEPPDVNGLRAQTLISEVEQLQKWLDRKADRMAYYDEGVTHEEINFLQRETRRIIRDLS